MPDAPSTPVTPAQGTTSTPVTKPTDTPVAKPQESQSSLPAVGEVLDGLSKLAQSWIENHAGKNNHNPYLRVAQLIQPVIDSLKKEGAQVTPQILAQVKSLPATPPVLDPNYHEPTAAEIAAQTSPLVSPKTVGAQNVK